MARKAIIQSLDYLSKDNTAWADTSIKGEIIEFSNEKDLKNKLFEMLKENDYIINKRLDFKPIYRDDKNGKTHQVGYFFNCQISILWDENNQGYNGATWKRKSFEGWVELAEISNLFEKVA